MRQGIMRNIYTHEGGRYKVTKGKHSVIPLATLINPIIIYVRLIVHTFFVYDVGKREDPTTNLGHPLMESDQCGILLLFIRRIDA